MSDYPGFDAALDDFNAAAQELSRAWEDADLEVEDYPSYLPSFDEFALNFANVRPKRRDWREQYEDRYPITKAQAHELARVILWACEDDKLSEEVSIRPCSADDKHSMIDTGEICHRIDSVTLDEGGEHHCVTIVGQSGKVYSVDETH